MNNKTSDKNVGTIEDDVKRCNELIKVEHANWIGISNQLAISHILAELEQKDKQIKALEDKLQDINTYILINGIDKPLRTATQIQAENQHEYIIQQKINELEKERDHWHGCFIVAMENSIPKQVVIDEINEINKKYEDSKNENGENPYFYPNFTIKTLQKILEGEK